MIRIRRAFKAFDIRAMLIHIKDFTKQRMKDKIKDDPLLAEDTITDHNNVNFLINMGNGLKIFKLVVVILNITYFVGISFMIISEVNMTIARMHSQGYLDD